MSTHQLLCPLHRSPGFPELGLAHSSSLLPSVASNWIIKLPQLSQDPGCSGKGKKKTNPCANVFSCKHGGGWRLPVEKQLSGWCSSGQNNPELRSSWKRESRSWGARGNPGAPWSTPVVQVSSISGPREVSRQVLPGFLRETDGQVTHCGLLLP